MAIDRARTVRGALAGALAASAWALQQPLDKRAFGVAYDDTEILGKLVTRRGAWPAVGFAMHVANGAVFGAVYANVARHVPLPSWARGPAAAMAEHLATWPLISISDRVHPARHDLPRLAGSAPAFAQAAWRHLLFGLVLGEVERRLNAPADGDVPPYEHVVSSNGHGNIEHAISEAPG